MVEILVPIFVCVVLPVSIVLIVSLRKWNSDNKRAEVLTKAIESGRNLDTEQLIESLRDPRNLHYSEKEILYARLQRGCMFTLIGIALGIVFFSGIIHDIDLPIMVLTVSLVCLAIGIAYLIVFFVSRSDTQKDE